MDPICSLRILTARLGGGMKDGYYTIPLDKKPSYKLANEVGHNRSFSIEAYAWNPQTNEALGRALPREAIETALTVNGNTKISSATGTVYLNLSYAKEKPSYDVTHGVNGGMTMAIKSVMTFANMLYGATQGYNYEFSLTARPTKATRYEHQGEVTLSFLCFKMKYGNLWELPSPGSTAKKLRGVNETVENTKGTFKTLWSIFG